MYKTAVIYPEDFIKVFPSFSDINVSGTVLNRAYEDFIFDVTLPRNCDYTFIPVYHLFFMHKFLQAYGADLDSDGVILSPIHLSDDEHKKSHFHVITNNGNIENLLANSEMHVRFFNVRSFVGNCRYLWHLDDPNKEQWVNMTLCNGHELKLDDLMEFLNNGGFVIGKGICPDYTPTVRMDDKNKTVLRAAVTRDILQFVTDNPYCSFRDVCEAFAHDDFALNLLVSRSYFFRAFCRGD